MKIAKIVLCFFAIVFVAGAAALGWWKLFYSSAALQYRPYKIAVVLRSVDNPSNVEMEHEARTLERSLGLNIIVRKVVQEISAREQIEILHQLADEDVDAVILDPVDSMALLPVVNQYMAAGIPVVNVGCRLDPASMVQFNMSQPPFVGIDNEKAAYDVGRYLSERVASPTNVVLLMGTNTSITSDMRKKGALRAFEENPYCVLKMAKIVYWNKNHARAAVEQLLRDYDSLGVVFCVDDVVAAGAVEALRQSGREMPLVSGFGDLKSTEELIQRGFIKITVAERSGRQMATAIQYALDLIEKKSVPQATYIDYALVDEAMLLER